MLGWKCNSAWSEWQRNKIYAWTIYNGCLQFPSFQLFCLESSTVSSEHQCLKREVLTFYLLLSNFCFNPFIRQVSLLQCLIVILWPDLKMARFNFFCFVFLNTAARVRFIPDEITYMVAEMIKTRGWWILSYQPHTGKIIFIPLHEVRFGGWGLAGENAQPGVFVLFPVQKEPLKNLCSWAHTFFIIRMWTGMPGSALQWGRAQPLWVSRLHLLGRERGFLWNRDCSFLMKKPCVTFSLPLGSAQQELNNLFSEWWRFWVCCKNQSLCNREVSNVLALKKIVACLQFSSGLSFLSTKMNGNYKSHNLKKN